jgi:uncharacterized protein (TIGR01777 family)
MPVSTFESSMPASPQELFAWHTRPGAFARLKPPWQKLEILEPAPVANGSRVRLRLKKGWLWLSWTAEHHDVEPGRGFTDSQISGPFSRWIHRHEFEGTDGGSLLRDSIDYELPGGPLGRAIGTPQVRRDLERTFGFRHERTRRDLERHRAFATAPRLRLAVSGASGLVGASLVPFLTTGGHDVVRLVRGEARDPAEASWSPAGGILEPQAVAPIDAVVHLAGENVASGRWSAEKKARIRDSRVLGTRNLVESLRRMEEAPSTLVCASAIGFYGSRGAQALDEASAAGKGFLAETCQEWEQAALEAEDLGMRVVLLRFGVVLSPEAGALAKMLPIFRAGLGGRLGDGRQHMSWVSIDDAVAAIYQALLDPGLAGPVNVTAPEAATNAAFTRALGTALRRPTFFSVPAALTRVAFGEMADEMLLASAAVRPQRLLDAGFRFFDTALEDTLALLFGTSEAA